MSNTSDLPISGLPEPVRPPTLDDLLMTSQFVDNRFFSAKLTLHKLLALFIDQLQISSVGGLVDALTAIQNELDNKVSGNHTHEISEVLGLVTALNGKSNVGHGHSIDAIDGLRQALQQRSNGSDHIHAISQVTGLQTALNGKAAFQHDHILSDIQGLDTRLANMINRDDIGQPNGVAGLDANGFIDDSMVNHSVVQRENVLNFPTTGVAGKLYLAESTGIIYRWNGTNYVGITSSTPLLMLGETADTAYRGDRGKIAYNHSQSYHAPFNAQKNSDITKQEIEAKLVGNIQTHTHPDEDVYSKIIGELALAISNERVKEVDDLKTCIMKLQGQLNHLHLLTGMDTLEPVSDLTAVYVTQPANELGG